MKKNLYQSIQTFDEVDLQILNALRENARVSLKSLAEKTYLSSTAVAARIEKLEREGIIEGYYAKINPRAFGVSIKAFIHLELEPIQKQSFYPYIRSLENVVACDCVTGEYSMLLEVLFSSTIELDDFINELQHFGKTKTQIVFSSPVSHREYLPKTI